MTNQPASPWARASSVAGLFQSRALVGPDHLAIDDGEHRRTFSEVLERVQRWAGVLRAAGVGSGDRVAILSRNRAEYLEVFLAGAWVGAVVACQNWRLSRRELDHCLGLVEPSLVVVAPELADQLAHRSEPLLTLGAEVESRLATAEPFLSLLVSSVVLP